eukprot:TRINITY_DN25_c4_g1_i1.p1 TRINITY_DN25_c4_g1~~TRINITY_DN25_c4_g1_i1.p1  ORF type:complete len:829 (-),score=196.44 TRINITY_DN25_c4_g1_i1:1229-3715(-)
MPLGLGGDCSTVLHRSAHGSSRLVSSSSAPSVPSMNSPCRAALHQARLSSTGGATRSFLPPVQATGKEKEWVRKPLFSWTYPGLFGPSGSALDWSCPDFVLSSCSNDAGEAQEGRTGTPGIHGIEGTSPNLLEPLGKLREPNDAHSQGRREGSASRESCRKARTRVALAAAERPEGAESRDDWQGGAGSMAEEDLEVADWLAADLEARLPSGSERGQGAKADGEGGSPKEGQATVEVHCSAGLQAACRQESSGLPEGEEASACSEGQVAADALQARAGPSLVGPSSGSGEVGYSPRGEVRQVSPAAGLRLGEETPGDLCDDMGFCCSLPAGLLGTMADWKDENANAGEVLRRDRTAGVPVYVMLPLDSVTPAGTINRPRAFLASLLALKSAGVEGVMMDIWWGIVEREGPGRYQWGAYAELLKAVQGAGLKLQAVMSFHQCGGNVGDHCCIPLPPWVLEEMAANLDIAYTDRSGGRNAEYISLGCDDEPVLRGRTPIEVYRDFMYSFRNEFCDYLGEVITEIQVGMGPAGELRYPSYPESNDRWRFPGIGEFQCYDKYMLASLREEAEAAGVPLWGLGGPHDSGTYKQWPEETGFFRTGGSWDTPYGDFFLRWYSGRLLQHGDRVLAAAASVFHGCSAALHLSGKVAGIHWHYRTPSHAAELTAGYYNTLLRDGYVPLARLFAKHNAVLNFTCLEMRDYEQPWWVGCSPEGLVRQVVAAAKQAGTRVAGENALPRLDAAAHEQIVRQSRLQTEGWAMDEPMASFTFLRMSERMFHPDSWTNFVFFVRQMKEGRNFEAWEEEPRHSLHHHINTTLGPLSQAAAAELMLR